MANLDKPHGFRPVAGPYREREYEKDASATAVGGGDIVVQEADGYIARAAASFTKAVGVALTPSPASTAGKVLVSDHPETIFEGQTDGSSGGGGADLNAQAAIGLNANIVDGTPVNGHSIQEIDQDSGATTSTLPIKILRLYKAVNNEFGDFNRLEFTINNHLYGSAGTDGI